MLSTTPPTSGAMSQEAMIKRFSQSPSYRASADAPVIRFAVAVEALWGARLTPIMAADSVAGRFARAALPSPATACTGAGEMSAGAQSRPYRNPVAIENILCLEGSLRLSYGPALDAEVVLNRFDMVSVPAGVRHVLHNDSEGTVRFVMVLSTDPTLDYSAIFDASDETTVPNDARIALRVSFDGRQGVSIDPSVLESRVTRFEKLVPYKKDLKNTAGIPPEATEMLTAGSVFPLIVPEGHIGRSRTAPMYGYQGLYISIAECAPGDDGPPPHAHSDTQESFLVLDGEWDISTGFESEYSVLAKPFDIAAMPNKVMRTFRNRSDKPSRLLVIIQGPDRMNDTVSFSRKIGAEIENRFGKETIEAYERIRMTFDAEERLGA